MINPKSGFTLIELLTSIAIFSIVMVVSLGSITGVFDANRKSRSLKAVINNLNLAMETMSKEMRFGSQYHCGDTDLSLPKNCPEGGTMMAFLSSEGEQITYRLAGNTLEKKIASGAFTAVTAPELILDELTFYTLGAGTTNTLQPKVLIKLRGHSGGTKGRTDLVLQTLVSQRLVDTDPILLPSYTSPSASYTTPATFRELVVTKAGTGTGTVSGPGISCGTNCDESYTNGSGVALTAAASGGGSFTGWSGACSGTGNCNLTMTADLSVTATFSAAYTSPPSYPGYPGYPGYPSYGYPSYVQYCHEPGGYGTGAGCPNANVCLYGGTCSAGDCWPDGYPRANVNGCCSGREVGGGEVC
jgi:prepilin-type N-terminal cleavage/methylation domain-containing protein